MQNLIVHFALKFFVITLLCGCSVMAAANGSREPDFSKIQKGNSRTVIEQEFGEPVKTSTIPSGTQSTYGYKLGDEPAIGRAIMHGVLDLVTFFLWEYIAFPMEISMSGNAYETVVDYNSSEKAIRIINTRNEAG